MAEYIEREAAKDAMTSKFNEDVEMYGVEIPECFDSETANNILDALPAADVKEVVHGEWLPIIDANEDGSPYQSGVYCSECGHCDVSEYNFCPNCGAKMEG